MPHDHLDDHDLSALVDGEERDTAAADHLAACDRCAARIDAFRRATAVVATPVTPLPAATAEAMVGRAVGTRVLPLARARARLRARTQAAVAVAAVAALILGVPFALRNTGERRPSGVADLGSAADKRAGVGATAREESADAAAPDQPDAAARTVAPTQAAGAQPPGADLGAVETDSELVSLLRARGAETQPSGPPAPAAARCEANARRIGGRGLRSLEYAAALRWQGAPAEVLVFALETPDEGATRQAYVMVFDGCGLRADPRF